jgi:hypothetical protein
MREHLEKAKSNEKFLLFIEQNAVNDFYDWKITVIFYIALHYIKALLKFKKKPTGYTHFDLDKIINPCKPSASCPFPQDKYDCYNDLYIDSRNARYSPVYSTDFQILLVHVLCEKSKTNLGAIKKYVVSEGLKIT